MDIEDIREFALVVKYPFFLFGKTNADKNYISFAVIDASDSFSALLIILFLLSSNYMQV